MRASWAPSWSAWRGGALQQAISDQSQPVFAFLVFNTSVMLVAQCLAGVQCLGACMYEGQPGSILEFLEGGGPATGHLKDNPETRLHLVGLPSVNHCAAWCAVPGSLHV